MILPINRVRMSYFRMLVILGLYVFLSLLYSIKTIYYYNTSFIWWVYFSLLTILFGYFVYHCFSSKPYQIYLLICFSFILGYFPFEVVIPTVVDLLTGNEKSLSGLAEMVPYGLGIWVDILFYPLLVSVVLVTVRMIVKAK